MARRGTHSRIESPFDIHSRENVSFQTQSDYLLCCGLYRLAVESGRAAHTHKQDPDKSRAYFFAAYGELRMKPK